MLIFCITFIIYLLPSLILLGRKCGLNSIDINGSEASDIFFLNLFLGWTIIVWVIALVLAITWNPIPS